MRIVVSAVILVMGLLPLSGCSAETDHNDRDFSEAHRAQMIASRSEIGDLRTRKMRNDDVEIRFWGGRSSQSDDSTQVVVLIRRDGQWSGLIGRPDFCYAPVPDHLVTCLVECDSEYALLFPVETNEYYEFRSTLVMEDCEDRDFSVGGTLGTTVDTLYLSPLPDGVDLSSLVGELFELGIDDLGVEGLWHDIPQWSHTPHWVIELATPAGYSLTEVDQCRHCDPNDVRYPTARIARHIDKRTGSALSAWEE